MNVFKDFVKLKLNPTDRLLDEISDYDIYCELTGIEFEFGKAEISPIRLDDDSPSFSLFIPTKQKETREEEVWWRDFRDGSGNVFKFVKIFAQLYHGLELKSRLEVVKFIDAQLGLGLYDTEKKYVTKRTVDYTKARETKDILFKSRDYTERDLRWWLNIGVDKPLLEKHDIRSVRHLLNDDFTVRSTISMYNLCFAMVVYDKIKLYRPEARKEFKWFNTCPSEYIQGWQQLNGSDVLIITKSYKDVLCFKSFMGVDVIAPQSESSSLTDEHINFIKNKYKTVYVVYDYDEGGKIGAEKLRSAHGFTIKWVSTEIDQSIGKPLDKDFSDYLTNHGLLSGFNHLKGMFPELDASYFREDRVSYLQDMIDNF